MIVKAIDDTRAMTDIGSAIFVKRAGQTKYSLWLAVTNIPATGSAPEQVETTVTTSRKKTYTYGRQDNPQKECTFYAHRDNFNILKNAVNKEKEFLQINPDGTGWKFNGYVSFYQNEVSVGNNIEATYTITVTDREQLPLNDVRDLIEDTAVIDSILPDTVVIQGTGTNEFNVVTLPADATVTAETSAESVATVEVDEKKVTVTGVAKGYAIVTLTTAATGYATQERTIMVEVTD